MKLIGKAWKIIFKPFITIAIALVIGSFLIINAGESPLHAYGVLFRGAFGSPASFMNTLSKATPLIFTGLAAAVASQAGVFNIGIEGQLYFGAIAAAIVGTHFEDLPSGILTSLCILAAMLAAALWALLPGMLNSRLDINIFIMFFILNNMAKLITEYLANGPFKGNLPEIATNKVFSHARLKTFSPRTELNVGFIIALLLVLIFWAIFKKTSIGYKWSALGNNRNFAEYIGIKASKTTLIVLAISAMIAGIAGAERVLGPFGRFYGNFSNDLGFTGISIALLASNNPFGVVVFAIFFGALNNGGQLMSVGTNVPSDLINVIQAIMIMFISGDFILRTGSLKFLKKGAKV